MSFGFGPFASNPFSSVGIPGDDATVNLSGVSLTATVSNAYTVQKTHFVNGFNLTSNTGTLTPKLIQSVTGNAVTSAVNSVVPSTGSTRNVTGNAVN